MLPKSLLPLPTGETLLTRVLRQLQEVGVSRAIISTTERHISVLRECKKRFQCEVPESAFSIAEIVENDSHRFGPISALASVVGTIQDAEVLLCLPDIFCVRNPFVDLGSERGAATTVLLGDSQVGRGGVVATAGDRVSHFQYEAYGRMPKTDEVVFNWIGAARLGPQALQCLTKFAMSRPEGPLELLFQDLLDGGLAVSWSSIGKFVNVNSFGSLSECLSIYHDSEAAHRHDLA